MKKLFNIILAASILAGSWHTAFALATKELPDDMADKTKDISSYTIFEDFSKVRVNNTPDLFSAVSSYSNTGVYVVKGLNEEGEKANLLKVEDKNPSSNVYFDIPVNQTGNRIIFETKIMFERPEGEIMSFAIDLYGKESTQAARFIQFSGKNEMGVYSTAGVNKTLTPNGIEPGSWYTIEIIADKVNNTFGAQVQSEAMKGISAINGIRFDSKKGVTMYNDAPAAEELLKSGLKKIRITTTSKTGNMYIDYYGIKDNVKELEFKGEKPIPLPLPEGKTPEILPSEDTINVKFKGEYLYFTFAPFEENGEVYIPLITASAAYNYKTEVTDGIYTLSKPKSTVKVNSKTGDISINGANLNNKSIINSGVIYIPVLEFSKALGDNATYDTEVIIFEGSAAK